MLNALMLDTDGQRLGDDSMEGVAAHLLLADGNDGGSLFNDSLDEDSHAATTKTTRTAAASPVHQQHDLNDDSLSFDTTQLPFDNDTAEPLTHSNSKAGSDVPVETKCPTAGFELAKNISISRPTELERKGKQYSVDIESAVVPEPYTEDDSNIKLSTSSSATLPTASKAGASTKAKSPKVVPSFRRRKAKTQASSPHETITDGNKSPNSDSTSDSRVPVGNQVADYRDIPNDTQGNEGGERVIEGDDQCVPQTRTGNTGKSQKPKFGKTSASKKKTPPQQTTTSGQGKKTVASKKTGVSKIPSVGSVDDQNMTNEGESVPHNTTTTNKEDQDELSADKTSSKRKGKKLAEREEKKREREEKKREAEQKKRETEAKKAEKERLKKERQLELERKKAEKEQKKIEQALKKAERMTSKKEGKQTGGKGSRKSKQSDDGSCSNAAEGHTGSSLVVEQSSDDRETDTNEMEEVPDRTDGNPDQMETKPDQMRNESDELQIELEQMEGEPDQEVDQKNNDRDRQEPVQNRNQEAGNEKVRLNDKSVAGVTAPEEGASLATDPSNANTTTNHPLPASITSDGYGHSTPGAQSQEPSESAAILPDDVADEGACNVPTSGDTDRGDDGSMDQASEGSVSSQSPESTSTLQPSTVLKERNTAKGNISGPREREDKENCSLPTKEASGTCSARDGKVKIVFGKVKKTTQKKDEAKATTQRTNSLKPTQAEKKRNSAPKKTTSRQLKPNTASTTSKESLPTRKRSRTSSPKPKKRARAQKENSRPGSSGGDGEGQGEESSNSCVGPVWVQCEKASCQKWRKLRDCSDPLSLPDSWTCSMNTGRHSTHTMTLQIQDNLFIGDTWFCPTPNKGHL